MDGRWAEASLVRWPPDSGPSTGPRTGAGQESTLQTSPTATVFPQALLNFGELERAAECLREALMRPHFTIEGGAVKLRPIAHLAGGGLSV